MLVFKFGGASVKNAEAVKNVLNILQSYRTKKVVLVISAMGKSTNLLEKLVAAFQSKNEAEIDTLIEQFSSFHRAIVQELFPDTKHPIYEQIEELFSDLENVGNSAFSENYAFEYDQIVSQGEILSTVIVEAYLREQACSCLWLDARKLIRTNHNYRQADVDWVKTEELIRKQVGEGFLQHQILVTQGFIGHTSEGFTTTLGREGSDFTAGIIAYCMDAASVTIWKDVPGMLNADPKYFDNTVKLDKISFKEAIELAYYGASVIHPKTIKPLQNKNIPLYVKSFIEPNNAGSVIQASGEFDHLVPSFIFKMNQVLFSIIPKDFSFLVEHNLSEIFELLASKGLKVNLMQNSAVSFSFALDQHQAPIPEILALFEANYSVRFNADLELLTIRHYDKKTLEKLTSNKELLVQQLTRQTARFLMKGKG